ncbi:MAG: glycosyltransferase family 39 protein [Phycisphaerales bacterium JB063]
MTRVLRPLRALLRRLFWPPHRLAGVLVLAAVLWRVGRWAAGFPLWGDESFIAVNFLTRGYGEMVGGLDHAQVAPLGFLWAVLAISQVLGTSEMVLRLLPTLAGLGSLVLLWRWAPRALPRRGAWLGVAIFAASYYPVRHANEVKPYAVDLLVSLVITVLAWWVWQHARDAKRWVLLGLGCAVAIWFSYTSAFVAAGVLLALLGKVVSDGELRRAIVPWAGGVLSGVGFAASGLGMWRTVGSGQSDANESLRSSEHWSLAFPPGLGETASEWLLWPVRFLGWFFEVHTGNMFAYPVGGKNGASSLTFLLVVIGCVALWHKRHPLLPILLLPAVVCLAAAAMRLYPYGSSARTTLFLAPAICLLAGVGSITLLRSMLPRREAVRGARFVAFIMLCVVIGGAVRDIKDPYKHPSDEISRATVRELGSTAEIGDRWVLVGSLRDTGWAPNLIGWGGSAARTRHYLIQEARAHGVELLFAPDPTMLVADPVSSTVLIVYRDNKYGEGEAFPAEQIAAYRAAAEVQFGTPADVEEHDIGKGDETLWFYVYPPGAASR